MSFSRAVERGVPVPLPWAEPSLLKRPKVPKIDGVTPSQDFLFFLSDIHHPRAGWLAINPFLPSQWSAFVPGGSFLPFFLEEPVLRAREK